MQIVLSHLHMRHMKGRITTFLFSKCSIICLLTFDLSLAIEWPCFFPLANRTPLFESVHPLVFFSLLGIFHDRKLPNRFCVSASV